MRSWRRHEGWLLLALVLLTPICLLGALLLGSVPLDLHALWQGDALSQDILWQLRVPRISKAFAVGGLLGLAGTLLQVLLRNPLADPYVLGLSSGAALGSVGALFLGLGFVWLPAAGFAGALGSTALLFVLARSPQLLPEHLLLNGIMLAAVLGAGVTLLLTLSPDPQLRGLLFWLMGDLGQNTGSGLPLLALGLGLLAALALRRGLLLLNLGELQAAALGLHVTPWRWSLFALTAGLTASAVASAGGIGFVGLLVPHLLRVMQVAHPAIGLLGAVLLGGDLLVLADLAARSMAAPLELPVGAITALLGGPLFLWLLRRSSR